MKLTDKEILLQLGAGEPIESICTENEISLESFQVWWQDQITARVPEMDGSRTVQVEDKVEILRDQWGVPHIFAKTDSDLFFGNGYATAQDRLWQLDRRLREACDGYEFHAFFSELHNFCAVELSAFYFDVRKDVLYCDALKSPRRRAARTALDNLFGCLTAWLAPFTCFTAEEAWLTRHSAQMLLNIFLLELIQSSENFQDLFRISREEIIPEIF